MVGKLDLPCGSAPGMVVAGTCAGLAGLASEVVGGEVLEKVL